MNTLQQFKLLCKSLPKNTLTLSNSNEQISKKSVIKNIENVLNYNENTEKFAYYMYSLIEEYNNTDFDIELSENLKNGVFVTRVMDAFNHYFKDYFNGGK